MRLPEGRSRLQCQGDPAPPQGEPQGLISGTHSCSSACFRCQHGQIVTSRGSLLPPVASHRIPQQMACASQPRTPPTGALIMSSSGFSDKATKQNSEKAQLLHPSMPNNSVESAKPLSPQVNPWIRSPPKPRNMSACSPLIALLCFRGSSQQLSQPFLTELIPHLLFTIQACPVS